MSRQLTTDIYLYNYATKTAEKIKEPTCLTINNSEILIGEHVCFVYHITTGEVWKIPYDQIIFKAAGENIKMTSGSPIEIDTSGALERKCVLIKPTAEVLIDSKRFLFDQANRKPPNMPTTITLSVVIDTEKHRRLLSALIPPPKRVEVNKEDVKKEEPAKASKRSRSPEKPKPKHKSTTAQSNTKNYKRGDKRKW